MSIRSEPRGSTLIEVLIAGALLALGMTAIAAMMNESVLSSRMAVRKTEASQYAMSTLERVTSAGYRNIAPGTYDGGAFINDAGVVLYQTTIVVSADAGAGIGPGRAYFVEVTVAYKDNGYVTLGTARERYQRYATIIPDGG